MNEAAQLIRIDIHCRRRFAGAGIVDELIDRMPQCFHFGIEFFCTAFLREVCLDYIDTYRFNARGHSIP